MKKSIYLFVCLTVLVIGLVGGALWHWAWWYPFPQLSAWRATRMTAPEATAHWGTPPRQCPVVNVRKLDEIRDILQHAEIEDLFWGDSVVEGMHDSRLFGVSNFLEIGHSGQIVFCAMNEIPFVMSAKPKRVMIYLGGNDAFGQSWYGPDDAADYYNYMVDTLAGVGIEVIVHQIHHASYDRNPLYVARFNERIAEHAESLGLLVIPPMDELKYALSRQHIRDYPLKTTYDGEHLKPDGYRIWIDHIRQYVPDF